MSRILLTLLVSGATFVGVRAAEEPQLNGLTPEVRQRLDREADALKPESASNKPRDWAGNITVWLLAHAAMTPDEEKEAADIVQKRLLNDHKDKIKPTPDAAKTALAALLKGLSDSEKPEAFTFDITVLDSKEALSFTTGAGHLWITTALLDPLLADRSGATLSYFLAHELGHVIRLHTRRGYQVQKVLSEVDKDLKIEFDGETLKDILETSLAPKGALAPLVYTQRQQYEADLFALHLCRNIKLDLDAVMDGPRWLALTKNPDGLRRLQRLRHDRFGFIVEKEQHGLFRWEAGEFTRCKDGEFKGSEKPIVFVHGLRGGRHSFEEFLRYFSKQKDLKDRPLLCFIYPNNGSLSRAGQMLANEMTRVVGDAKQTSFVAHSAGGLTVRYYVEKLGSACERAFLLGTPNEGSNLTKIKFLLDAGQFIRLLRRGLPDAIANIVAQGDGQISHDLQPESLFLRYLGHDAKAAGKYHIVYGKALLGTTAKGLAIVLDTARLSLQDHVDGIRAPLLKSMLQRVVAQLQLPDEIAEGDWIVRMGSARLEGSASEMETRLNHQTLKTNEEVMRAVYNRLK